MSDPHDPYSPPPAAQPDLFRVRTPTASARRNPTRSRRTGRVRRARAAGADRLGAEPCPAHRWHRQARRRATRAHAPGRERGVGRLDRRPTVAGRIAEEVVAWLKTLASAAVYATLIVTFGFQVARVEGQSMAPTLADQDRLIVNKAAYRFFEEPQIGDIVMLYYPLNPDKSFVKRVIAKEGDQVRIVDGRVYRNDVLINDDYVPDRVPQPRRLGPRSRARGPVLRDGRSPQQQLRQPALEVGAEEIHHRQSAAPLVAAPARASVLTRVLVARSRAQPRGRRAPSWRSATRPARSASFPTASTRSPTAPRTSWASSACAPRASRLTKIIPTAIASTRRSPPPASSSSCCSSSIEVVQGALGRLRGGQRAGGHARQLRRHARDARRQPAGRALRVGARAGARRASCCSPTRRTRAATC